MQRETSDVEAFDAVLAKDGYGQIETKSRLGGDVEAEHAHGYDVRALVLEGAITLT